MELLDLYGQLGVRDAVHVATAIEAGLHTIVSTDRAFDSIDEVAWIDPGQPDTPWALA